MNKTHIPFIVAILCLCACGRFADGDDQIRRSIGQPRAMVSLPKHVIAPEGKLTLFADFNDVRGDELVLYLVNRTKESTQFDAQNRDIYVKFEFKNDDGTWIRAQTHQYSWCGNSYMYTPALKPGEYFRFLGYFPSKGVTKTVRYRRYAGNLDLWSNVGTGLVDVSLVDLASYDRMAIKTGSFDFVSRIATGMTSIPQSKQEWADQRHTAISTLVQERFADEDVASVLESIMMSDDQDLVRSAQWVMKQLESRK
ncbi:hypothetical protein BH23VER1_BH23VER1_26510 [soil metagenome]